MKFPFGYLIIAAVAVFAATACSSHEEPIAFDADAPTQTMKDVDMFQSDSGVLQMKIKAPVVENYEIDENKTKVDIQKFPKGINVTFFNAKGQITVIAVAKEAIHYPSQKRMEMYKDVVVRDYRKGDTLYTDELIWDQNKSVIYSNKPVRQVMRDGSLLRGDGFDSDDNMNEIRLRRPRGVQVF